MGTNMSQLCDKLRLDIRNGMKKGMEAMTAELSHMVSQMFAWFFGNATRPEIPRKNGVERNPWKKQGYCWFCQASRIFISDHHAYCPGTSKHGYFFRLCKINARWTKLECPRFDGTDFLGWHLKVEQFFEAVGISGQDKVQRVIWFIWQVKYCNSTSNLWIQG